MNSPNRNDKLAENRTQMANQRTFLSFVRTALMLFATGITFIKLFAADPLLLFAGWVLLPISAVVLALGLRLYLKMKREIKEED